MTGYVQVGGLQVAKVLYDFVNNEAIPGTGIVAEQFWAGAEKIINDLAPKNKALLAKRDELQAKIDAWHQARKGQAHDAAAYKAFLQEIGYLLPQADDFRPPPERGRRNRPHGRPTTGRSGDERPLRPERRQRPLGFAVRRPLRHRRHQR